MAKPQRSTLRCLLVILAAGTVVLPACSSDDEKDSTTTSAAEEKGSGTEDSQDETETTADEGDGETATAVNCDELLSIDEVQGVFGEPAVLEETDELTSNEDLGQTTCTWSTVEDEDDIEDLASQLIVLQYYDGSTMSGANFYDPEVQYPDSEPLDIGDEGFVSTSGGVDIGFVKDDTSGFVSYSAIDLSGGAPDAAAKKDAVIDLARKFEERVS